MRLIAKKTLVKLKKKNIGNRALCNEIDRLIAEIETANWKSEKDIYRDRPDADCVHNDGFYFFNIAVHRTMIMIQFNPASESTVVWAGTHQEYEETFNNNKKTIEKWLRKREYIL